MKIVINSMDFHGSFVNGPGIRSLLFLQGCSRHCEGCHNPSTWSHKDGKEYEVDELATVIRSECTNRKITITGGEPLEQKEALGLLLQELEGFDVCLYTGYELEEVPEDIIEHLTYLKTGKYVISKRTTTIPFIGSTNQRFIKIRG